MTNTFQRKKILFFNFRNIFNNSVKFKNSKKKIIIV